MATQAWIDSAVHEVKPSRGNGGDIQSLGQHILVMARADAEREVEEQVLAGRAVRRVAGPAAAEVLAMLGLDEAVEAPSKTDAEARSASEKLCRDCGDTKPASEFTPRPRHADGLESYCRPCVRVRKVAWEARRRAEKAKT